MKPIKKNNILILLIISFWIISGCTQDPLTGFVIEGSSYESNNQEKQLEEINQRFNQTEEEIYLPTIKKGILEDAYYKEIVLEKEELEKEKEELEKKIEEKSKQINNLDKNISYKEIEIIEKIYSEEESEEAKIVILKEQLNNIQEQQQNKTKEIIERITQYLKEEEEIEKQLEELGEKVEIKSKKPISSNIALNLIEEATKDIESNNDKEALSKLKKVYEGSEDINLIVEAGKKMIDITLNNQDKKINFQSKKEMNEISNNIVEKARLFGKINQIKALETRMSVAQALYNINILEKTAKNILEIDPLNIGAHSNLLIAEYKSKKVNPNKIIDHIKEVEVIAEITDKKLPPIFYLIKASTHIKKGTLSDREDAKESTKTAITQIRQTNPPKEKLFNNLSMLKSDFLQNTNVNIEEEKIQIKDLTTIKTIKEPNQVFNVVNKMNLEEKTTIYAHYPDIYTNTITYNKEGHHKLEDGGIYYIKDGEVYQYNPFGEDLKIIGAQAEEIKNKIFNRLVSSGIEIPISKELLPETKPIKSNFWEKIFNKIKEIIFNQANPEKIPSLKE